MYRDGNIWPRWYRPQTIDAHRLVGKVADRFGVTREEICGDVRARPLPQARAVVAKILRERGMSYKMAGRFIGNRDHTSISYACANFDTHCRRDSRVLATYQALRGA